LVYIIFEAQLPRAAVAVEAQRTVQAVSLKL
jgi:hypothetical protein